jgi:glycosyltransferase involved in cell wall biosynthesis
MSHYARAIAQSLARYAKVATIDGADGVGPLRSWRRLRHVLRDRTTTVLNTSPHWAVPAIAFATRAHGGFVLHGPLVYLASRWTRPLYIAYYRILARRLGVVIIHAGRFRDSIRELGLRPRSVVVVPHGFVPEGIAATGAYDPAGPFVWVGKLLPYKGVDVFLRALELLAAEGRPVPAFVGGEGVTTDLAPENLSGLMLRPGRLSDEEFRLAIDGCAAVVLPYRKATQSGVLSTAFAAGRPVIATRVGSFPDYVDDSNGVLVPPDDPQRLADGIAAIREDAALANRLAAGARETWRDRLDPDGAAREILDALTA